MVISQARKGGFRLRGIDELADMREHNRTVGDRKETDSDLDKKGSQEFVEGV